MALLRLENITKRYPGVTALDGVTFTLEPAHVHCVVGENGAGKSTLVKILTGLERPDSGRIEIRGEDVTGHASRAVAYVPQELNLFDNLSVAENIFMPFGNAGSGASLFDRRRCEREALPLLSKLRMESAPGDIVRDISVAERQLLQIARAIVNTRFEILVLDEPTASLTAPEIERLFAVIEEMKEQRKSVIFITHRLDEVVRLHSVVTVLRNGKVVGNSEGETIDEEWIVEKMIGEELDLGASYKPRLDPGEQLLDVREFSGDGFKNISFGLREGEVLGFAGLVGAGRSEILQTIFGYRGRTHGEVRLNGELLPGGKTKAAIGLGIIYLSEERKTHGIFPDLSIAQNVGTGLLPLFSTYGVMSGRRERACTARIVEDYSVKTSSLLTKIRNLSGGNQQKVLIGRSLLAAPKVLFLDEPTRGIDVRAKADIFALIQAFAEEHRLGVVLISSDLEELHLCCNRVIAIYDGRSCRELERRRTDHGEHVERHYRRKRCRSGPRREGIEPWRPSPSRH